MQENNERPKPELGLVPANVYVVGYGYMFAFVHLHKGILHMYHPMFVCPNTGYMYVSDALCLCLSVNITQVDYCSFMTHQDCMNTLASMIPYSGVH